MIFRGAAAAAAPAAESAIDTAAEVRPPWLECAASITIANLRPRCSAPISSRMNGNFCTVETITFLPSAMNRRRSSECSACPTFSRIGERPAHRVELVEPRPQLHRLLPPRLLVLRLDALGVVVQDVGQSRAREGPLPQKVGDPVELTLIHRRCQDLPFFEPASTSSRQIADPRRIQATDHVAPSASRSISDLSGKASMPSAIG